LEGPRKIAEISIRAVGCITAWASVLSNIDRKWRLVLKWTSLGLLTL
jgi:hypothetical protein